MQKKRLSKRVRKLLIICTLTAIILTVSTYAWFVGLRSVRVSSFDVEIAAAESLSLSLDGEKWADEMTISKATLDEVSYEGHTNSWGGKGLIPMSSVGQMDATASRMILYEMASFTPTAGGYRIMASRVNNYNMVSSEAGEVLEDEQDGYVAFDLFIRNYTGTQYLTAYNEDDEEAIYLTTDSRVTVASDGVANTGIENSVRVAFAQIGRVAGTTTTPATITGITCTSDADVTGICGNRIAQIWEPNDKDHVQDAIDYYSTSCLAKTMSTKESRCKAACVGGGDQAICEAACETETTDCRAACNGENPEACIQACVGAQPSYANTCETIADGTAYKTYAVNAPIYSADHVDIYDGADYNKYEDASLLTAYSFFTDTMKNKYGVTRPQFMTLAPNSITKVRVYIYIEGQDIDNYDFAAIGKKISVAFGFTKQRFTPEDITYEGPYLPTTLGTCTGNENPTIEKDCTEARGIWTPGDVEGTGTCTTNGTKEYCDLTAGTFVAHGTCAGGTVPTEEGACTTAGGTWEAGETEGTGTCSGITETYCANIEGTFTPSIKQSER